jgi:transcriptional regulator with PAS, ATPase and Fis domain
VQSLFIAESLILREKLELAARFAAENMPILIMGEPGAGKAAFAEEIYRRRNAECAALFRINCFSPPEDWYGGAAGAIRQGRGLFFNGVDGFNAENQEAALRLIEGALGRAFIIASSRLDLEQMALNGSFRKDLALRIGVFPVCLPPLRQRPEDLKALSVFFLKHSAAACKKKITGFSDSAMERLALYSWPGNARELKNRVEYAVITGSAETGLVEASELELGRFSAAGSGIGPETALKDAVDFFKTEFIKKTLEFYDGNRSAAARSLDIQRTYLCALIKSLGIDGGV